MTNNLVLTTNQYCLLSSDVHFQSMTEKVVQFQFSGILWYPITILLEWMALQSISDPGNNTCKKASKKITYICIHFN